MKRVYLFPFSTLCSLLSILLFLSVETHHLMSNNNETDRLALLEFKARITCDPRGAMSSWNNSAHFCHWYGVTCGGRHQRVTVLNLPSLKLIGTIPPHIANLTFLKNLTIQANSFTGQIPPELGRLHSLEFLRLENNSLSGEIPANLSSCLNLIGIGFDHNQLSGSIPAEIGKLTNLVILAFDNNNLTGNIPSSLGNLSSLQALSGRSNHFSGTIPHTLGKLKNLTVLILADNNLEGTIPPYIYNLSALETFALYQNRLRGTLPSELGTLFHNLRYFGIFENRLSGSIPLSISNASNLEKIFIRGNKFGGHVPSLENLGKLEMLGVGENYLGNAEEGSLGFISTLTNATNLRWLEINSNNFGGVLPMSICNLSTIVTRLGLDNNHIVGTFLPCIGNLVNMEILSMWNNELSGSIPEDVGNFAMIQGLFLHINYFTGNIPLSIGNLSKVDDIDLSGNKLQGTIPSSFGKCRNLLRLTLADNNLNGSIPPEVLSISSLSIMLNLSMNRLTGSLPMEVGDLESLGILDVSQNMLSGAIPDSLGSCTSLEWLGLDHNFFRGTVPSSTGSLRGIKYLNLSHNNISGDVPNFLESFSLEKLDISFNNFSGVLPSGGIFNNASAISIDGNNMLCGGAPELHLPMCTFGEKRKEVILMEVKIIVVTIVFSSLVVIASLVYWLLKKKSRRAASSSSSNDSILQVSYQSLYKATDGFSSINLVGTGSFGSVYKGVLEPERIVAVKVFDLGRRGASTSFMIECEALKNIRHRNLVKVISACSSIDSQGNDFKAIVFEFMVNESLDQWLHETSRKKLTFMQRLNIAVDIACALCYLHHEYSQTSVVHCDLKPSNVLLDDEMTAKVGDFGLMNFLSDGTKNLPMDQPTNSIGVRGTIGYVAPEYGMGSEVSTHGDVYSFGILLLEMFTWKRPTDDMFDDNLNLHSYVKMAIPENVAEITDPTLQHECEEGDHDHGERYEKVEESLIQIFGIGIACSEQNVMERMDISDALSKLTVIKNNLITQHEKVPRKQNMVV